MTKRIIVVAGNIGVGKTSLQSESAHGLGGAPISNRLLTIPTCRISIKACATGRFICRSTFLGIVRNNTWTLPTIHAQPYWIDPSSKISTFSRVL